MKVIVLVIAIVVVWLGVTGKYKPVVTALTGGFTGGINQ